MRAGRSLGAVPVGDGVRFRVLAPGATRVDVLLEPDRSVHTMTRQMDGAFEAHLPAVGPGALYRLQLDGGPAYPDPASRFQPQGVHGPSRVVDPQGYLWQDGDWQGLTRDRLVFYELHVGTYTPGGTFAGVGERLPFLRDLGITAIELMPVADFPGRWNWGYDGAALFAPSRAYGGPDDLRALVDAAHLHGIAVFLDVVYNHVGPDGAYAPVFNPAFFSDRHRTPWGPAINLDGPDAEANRRFFVENALYWLEEYHLDGLRLDATHAIVNDSGQHILRELADAIAGVGGWKRYLVAEDHRNLNRIVLPVEAGGHGIDALWSDDYHHQVRRILAGDTDGYFEDFADSSQDLATIIRQGWLYTGQYSRYFGEPRGTGPEGIPLDRFVHFIQNHDQVGNRPTGQRITEAISLAAYRAVSALLLLAPELPLLFMGQEWAARTPFQYFTDHHDTLGRLVSEGRRKEFARFAGFGAAVPDPQDPETFHRSKLDWDEPNREPHAGILRLYRDLLTVRKTMPHERPCAVQSLLPGGLILSLGHLALLTALTDGLALPLVRGSRLLLHTEDIGYADAPRPPQISGDRAFFPRAGAALVELPPA